MSTDYKLLASRLAKEAWEIRNNAWVPYSGFRVGAAIYLPMQDVVVTGVNVENASFGATICAERSAILAAISRYGRQPIGMVVVATDAENPAVPCGNCLQVLAEFCEATMPLFLANAQGIKEQFLLSDLLPRPFISFSTKP